MHLLKLTELYTKNGWVLLCVNCNLKNGVGGKDMKNAFGYSGGWTGTEKRYLAKERGLSPSSDPRMTHRPPWASLSFGDPELQILKTCEVMSAPSPPASAHMWSFLPHIHLQWSLHWFAPNPPTPGIQGLADFTADEEKAWDRAIQLPSLSTSSSISAPFPPPALLLGALYSFPFVIKSSWVLPSSFP